MPRFVKMTALAGVPFGLLMGVVFSFRLGAGLGVVVGLLGGLVFGGLLAAFAAWQRSRFLAVNPCAEGEHLVKQGLANHFRGMEGVGGWLYLTDRRLLFRSHEVNVQRHELAVPLRAIRQARACLTAWVIPNGLRVETADGPERFVVEGRHEWAEAIGRAVAAGGMRRSGATDKLRGV